MTKYKDLVNFDIESIEPVDVSPFEKAKVKQHVLQKSKRKKTRAWRKVAAAAVIVVGSTITLGYTFPSVASQMPFMQNVISYFEGYKHFDEFSTEIGLSETSNGTTIMIDQAVYDGTTITVSYAIETAKKFENDIKFQPPFEFDVVGAHGMGSTSKIEKIGDTRYVGVSSFTPIFKKHEAEPETVQITWQPTAFTDYDGNTLFEGDWSFEFALTRVNGEKRLMNEATTMEGITLVIRSIEQTNVSTIIQYEQTINESIAKNWPEVSPIFEITDDLGNVYASGEGGGGVSYDNGMTFYGTTTMEPLHKDARKLIIQPTAILSLLKGEGHEKVLMDPIEIDLK